MKKLKPCPPDSVKIDIFGFSRGAALARHFVNVILDGLPDYSKPGQAAGKTKPPIFGAMRYQDGKIYEKLPNVTIRFVGLFDTVGSFYWPGNADNGEFNMHLPPGCAEKIYHLVAVNERRKNFRYTSVLPGDGEEEHLAGVHSDIGGGYQLYEDINLCVKRRSNFVTGAEYLVKESMLKEAAARGLESPPYEFSFADNRNERDRKDHLSSPQQLTLYLLRKKRTDNRYSHLALHFMHRKAMDAAVPLEELDETSPLHKIPDDLQALSGAPTAQISQEIWEKYIHVSSAMAIGSPELEFAKRPRTRYAASPGMDADGRVGELRGYFPNTPANSNAPDRDIKTAPAGYLEILGR